LLALLPALGIAASTVYCQKPDPFAKRVTHNLKKYFKVKFIYILGPTGFDSETNGIVSMSSAGI